MYTIRIKQHSKVLSILLVPVELTIYKYSMLLLVLVLVALYPVAYYYLLQVLRGALGVTSFLIALLYPNRRKSYMHFLPELVSAVIRIIFS